MSETLLKILLFEGVVFFLLAAVLVSRRFFRQPIDRIRITQAGFGLVVAVAVCIGFGVGPTWTIPLPVVDSFALNSPHPNPLPEGEGTLINLAPEGEGVAFSLRTTEQRALSRTDASPLPRPYTLMPQEGKEIRAHQSSENQRAASDDGISADLRPLLLSSAAVCVLLFAVFFFPPLFLFLRDWTAGRHLRKLLKNSHRPSEAITEMFRQISGDSRCVVRLRVSKEIIAPMVFGLFRPTLLLPIGLDGEKLRACLAHEWSHIRNGDLMTWNIVRWFQYLLWMQPFYWMLCSRLLADQDYLADDDGVQACGGTDYAQILVNFARTRSASAERRTLGMAGHPSQLKRRIAMLLNVPRPAHKSNKRKLLVPLMLLTAIMFFGGTLRFTETATEHEVFASENEPRTLESENTTTPVIRGKVVGETGPVAGILVRIFGDTAEDDLETTTNESGEFFLNVPVSGVYGAVYVTNAERTKVGQGMWFMNETTQEINEVIVSLFTVSRTITGTVVGADGKPAEGILVAGSYQTVHSEIVRTDKEGKFQFLYPKDAALLRIIAYKKGVGMDIYATGEIDPLQSMMGETVVTPSDTINDGPFHLKLAPIEPVQIRIVNEEGQPLAGAMVSPWLIQKPPTLPKPDPVMWDSPYNKEQQGNQFNTAGFMHHSFMAIANENGIATLETVPKAFLNETTFTAQGPREGVEVSGDSKRYYGSAKGQWKDLKIKDGVPTLTLPRQGSVRGTVKLEDGTPVPNVYISIRWHNGSGGGSTTDAKGEFRLTDNVNVIYNLSFVSNQGTAPSIFNLSLGDGTEEQQLDIVLKPGIRLYGNVFMPDGSPAENFVIRAHEKDPNPPATFDRNSVDWANRDGTLYTNDQADYQIHPMFFVPRIIKRQESPSGAYEAFLPAVPREYEFRAEIYPTMENPTRLMARIPDVRLLGTETEFKLDFYFSETGEGGCTPLATISATPTDETARPVAREEQTPWVNMFKYSMSDNPMIPLDPVIKVLDPEGKPMQDVEIDVRFNGEDRGRFKVKTDENGIASVKELETKQNTNFIAYTIRKSGYVFRYAEWGRESGFPQEHVFTMEKGIEVGGIVVDANNNPIQGATVNCSYSALDRRNYSYPAGEATTDADGKWSVNMAPESIRRFRLDVRHPDYMPSELTGTFPPYVQMINKTSVVMLRKGASLAGVVLDPDGKPVKDAKVVVTVRGQEFSGAQPQQTKEDGTFRFENWNPGPTTVYVAAAGFAPQTQEWSDPAKTVEFRLAPGRTIRVQVLDMDGKPIPQARVRPFRWRGTFLLLGDQDLIPPHTDDNGNWSWTWAPDDEVDFSIIREGYQSIRDLNLKAQDEPYVYRMRLPLEIRGTVTDAQSGETIRNITMITGGNFDGKNPKIASYWNEDQPSRFTDGNYRALYTEPRNGGGHHFKITAEGYEPFVSEMFTDDQGSLRLDVKLTRTQ